MRKTVYTILILTFLLVSYIYYSSYKKSLHDELVKEYKSIGCRLYHEKVLEGAPKWVQAVNYKVFGKNFAEFYACSDLTQKQLEEVLEFTKLTEVSLNHTKGLDLKTLSDLKLRRLSLRYANVKNFETLKEFDLEFLDLTASNFKDFTLIHHMKSLKSLVIDRISPEEKAKLLKHLPKCNIEISFEFTGQKPPN